MLSRNNASDHGSRSSRCSFLNGFICLWLARFSARSQAPLYLKAPKLEGVFALDRSLNACEFSRDHALVHIAPMVDVTYREFRQFMRLLTKKTQLWTEMLTDSAILHSDKSGLDESLAFLPNEHPIVAQLGGKCINTLTEAAEIVAGYGYDEINLNVGCPSERVSGKGRYGAALMREKELVRDIVYNMKRRLNIPVTVKHRLGVDDLDSYEFVREFVSTVSESGCDHFVVHARKALLCGLNARKNRQIPPLQYEKVYNLQRDFPHLKFTINGGFKTLQSIKSALELNEEFNVKLRGGVMVGRMAYENPCELARVDAEIYGGENPETCSTRRILLESYTSFVDKIEYRAEKLNIHAVMKPILGVFHGKYGNKTFRQVLSDTEEYKYMDFPRGETKYAKLIHYAISVMEQINPQVLDEPL